MSFQHKSLKIKMLGAAFLFFAGFGALHAQQELMLHSMSDIWHSNSTNPAFFPEDKFLVIGLPGIGLDAAHSGDIGYNDIFTKDGDRTRIDFSNALAKLDPSNTVNLQQRIETASVGIRLPGKFWLQAGHANRLSGSIIYPKTFPSLIWDGNAQYIGQTVEIAPQTEIANWNEWSIGLGKKVGKLSLGVRAKWLFGTGALKTDDAHHSATVHTSDDIYQLTLHTDYGFHAASFISSIDTSGLGYHLSVGELKGKAFTQNRGIAFDLGAQYQVSERLRLDVSVLDLGGKIKWKKDANYFLSQGDYEYAGTTLPGSDIINGSDSLDFSTKLDTLNDIFKFNKTAQEFETSLPLRAYAGGSYDLNKRWTLNAGLYFQQRAGQDADFAAGVGARWHVRHWLSLGAMYSIDDRSASNLGFHVMFKPGPLQLYFASDNLLNAFAVKSSPAVNLRAGLNLIF